MKLELEVKRSHAYFISSLLVIVASIGLVNAFGGTNPAVLGHSALELLVNGSSISNNNITSSHVLDNSLTGSDIDESTLSGTASSLTAGNANACDADGICNVNANLLFSANVQGPAWGSIAGGAPLISSEGGVSELNIGGTSLFGGNPPNVLGIRIAAGNTGILIKMTSGS